MGKDNQTDNGSTNTFWGSTLGTLTKITAFATALTGLILAIGQLKKTEPGPVIDSVKQHPTEPPPYIITRHDVEAFLESASNGDPQNVLYLLTLKMPVDTQLAGSNTALANAVLANKSGVVRILLEHHANPNIRISNGSVPLIEASYAGFTNVVELLIKNGADLNVRKKDGSGITALMFACIQGNTEIVRKLVENNADPNARSSSNTTAKDFANGLSSPKKEEIVAILNSVGAQ